MKKHLLIIGGIEAVLLLLSMLAGAADSSLEEGMLIAGILALILVGINLLTGFILAVAGTSGSPMRARGLAFLLLSGIMLLCSFTLCSQGFTAM